MICGYKNRLEGIIDQYRQMNEDKHNEQINKEEYKQRRENYLTNMFFLLIGHEGGFINYTQINHGNSLVTGRHGSNRIMAALFQELDHDPRFRELKDLDLKEENTS